MDETGFRQFLEAQEFGADQVDQFITLIKRFDSFQEEQKGTISSQVNAFSKKLVEDGQNDFLNYVALARYARFLHDNEFYISVVELVDGAEAMENLYKKLGEIHGEEVRDQIFADIEIPTIGSPVAERPAVTFSVMERIEEQFDPVTTKDILSSCLRDLEDEWYLDEREKYQSSKTFDEYLEQKGQTFIEQLEGIQDKGGLFFTQEISDDVLEFVRNTPEILSGVRDGHILYEVKIPYMTKQFLEETDERMKRYYYCHCPWIRESILNDDPHVSTTFCNCSAGFHKKPYEVIFEQPLQADIVETVLAGDGWCKFAIHLPEDVIFA